MITQIVIIYYAGKTMSLHWDDPLEICDDSFNTVSGIYLM